MKFRLLLLSLLFAGCFLSAVLHAATLVPTASTWRWRPGTNEASTPIPAWRSPDFADSQFSTAPAPFWYGDVLDGGTPITGMQGQYGCIFLRKTFTVARPSEISGLRMRALVDDGFVAWINGTEVLRVGMPGEPGGEVTLATLANNATEPVAFTPYDLAAPPSYLRAGENVLAVQVFQSSLGSSDLGFDASLESAEKDDVPPTLAAVTPQPSATVGQLGELTVTFSEPVTGVVAAHLLVNGIGANSVTAASDTTFTFTFTQPAYGNVSVTWNPAHTITDRALPPNRFNATAPGATWLYHLVDNSPPVVAGITPASGSTVRTLVNVSILFSEPVTGVDAADLLLNGVPAASLTTVAASQYIFNFPQPAVGGVQMSWAPQHGIQDLSAASNAFAGGSWTYRFDPNATDDPPYISEFMASNTRTLRDETGQYTDWIEIFNPSAAALDLDGWSLTDNANNLTKWRFPATQLPGGAFLVVFASGNDRRIPGARLHTNFQLGADGEYLALVRPDGFTVASEWAPAFPQQVPDVSFGVAQVASGDTWAAGARGVYFTKPTPGAANLGGNAVPGPRIESVQHSPNVPLDSEDLVVTALVQPSFRPVSGVQLRYRIMFGTEATTPMLDDGTHGDGTAGDGIYGAWIPANLSTNGQMIRYAVVATDLNANASRWPLFTSPTSTEEYLGTIVNPTQVTSKLPVFHLFVAPGQTAGIDSESGGRLSFFYDGEFYDNVYMELRGNTSAGLNKKSHRLEFNRGHELRHAGPGGRTKKSSLLAEHLDPAYLRQHLCFWFLNQIGVPAPYHYPVRVQLNGQFYQLAFHTDVIGQEQMERMGYDPRGALYKAVGILTPDFYSTGVFQKLEPDGDPSRTDYLQLANGIHESSSLTVRRNTVFDLLDLPQVINHLAGTRWCSENDDVWANMSLYRDTFGDGLWRNIPFDMNASWGQLYGGSNPLEATVDFSKSHPLYGGSSTEGNFNRLYDAIVRLPETRQMLLRRERSILDQMVQPPETPANARILENYIRQMTNLISAEANLDRAKWGFSPWAPGKTFSAGVGDLITQFIVPRRRHWYVTHSITNTSRPIGITSASNAGIPLPQPPNAYLTLTDVEFNPASGNQAQEFVALSNSTPVALDLSGWTLDGGVRFTFFPGTVIPSNTVVYVSPDVRQFRARTSGPRGGQGLFVVGPSTGQLSARGESLTLRNRFGQTVATSAYPGNPSPAQQFLRVTEIMFHPAPIPGNPMPTQDFEYLELKNISPTSPLDLTGVRLSGGIDFSFTGAAITLLPPGARVLVARNPGALRSRYGEGLPVVGPFAGQLDDGGERLQLLDASNEEILDFTYADGWYPLADGLGFSIVVVDETADPDAWSRRTQWRLSGSFNGTPGQPTEPPLLPPPPILVNEALTRGNPDLPLDAVELHNPTAQDVDLGGWWLTDDLKSPAKYRIPAGTRIPAHGYLVLDESQFGAGPAGFGLGSDGDEVWLLSADAEGDLTGHLHGHRFGAAEQGVSFGRHLTHDGREFFVAQLKTTLGSANSGPRVGPVLLHEIMYHPPSGPNANDASGEDLEYIELLNTSATPVPLFDPSLPANTWRLRGGVDFDFPTGVTLAGGEFVLLVNFTPTNAPRASAFRTAYGISADVRLFGPYSGRLDNAGQSVELKKPSTPIAGVTPYVLVDEADYRDQAPWAPGADGYGLSLQRTNPLSFGNDPASWTAAPPSPARDTSHAPAPATLTVQPQSQQVVGNSAVTLTVSAAGTPPIRYQWRFNGSNLVGGTEPTLTLPAVQPEQAGDYHVVAFNEAGSAISSNATLTVIFPPTLLTQPASAVLSPGATANFAVQARSFFPLSYQWRFNGIPLPGETRPSLSLPNAQPSSSGLYSVVVSDPTASVVSSNATLQVLVQPDIVTQPLSQSILPGGPVVLSLAVTPAATLPLGIRVRRNSLTLPPSPTTTFTIYSHSFFWTLSGADASPPWTEYSFVVTNQANPLGVLSATAHISYLEDSDADGLPDAWETNNFGSLAAEPQADPDSDGSNNRNESIAGTHPTEASSSLKLDAEPTPEGIELRFLAVSNRTYTLEFTDALDTPTWQKLADIPAEGADHPVHIIAPGTRDRDHRAYRLVTPRQP